MPSVLGLELTGLRKDLTNGEWLYNKSYTGTYTLVVMKLMNINQAVLL